MLNILNKFIFFLIDPQSCNIFYNNGKQGETYLLLKDAIKIISYIAPILLLIFVIKDIATMVISKEEDAKKAQSNIFKRLIAAIVIFFTPTILDIVLKLAGIVTGVCDLK